MKTTMYTVEELNQIIKRAFQKFDLESEPQNLYLPIKHVLGNGGKRIRPMLVLAACNLFSDSIDRAIDPAVAVEVFHNFTLVHDDIMDNADMRRGVVTVHKRWNSNTAILSGDAMLILAYKLLAKTSPDILPQVVGAFNELAIGVCEGQQYDMDFEHLAHISREQYITMIELKTAVLLRGALKIGAIIGGASQADIETLFQYGTNLGIAFQLQDDLLDVYGDSKVFGKNIGGDILAQKKTVLTIETRALLNGNDCARFDAVMQDTNPAPDQKISKIVGFYNQVGIKQHVEKLVDDYFTLANQVLDRLSVPAERKNILLAFTAKTMGRNY